MPLVSVEHREVGASALRCLPSNIFRSPAHGKARGAQQRGQLASCRSSPVRAGGREEAGCCSRGRVCVISGAGPGLGRQVALAAAGQGADVVLAARRQSVLEDVAREVEGLGRRALVVPTDITHADQCVTLAERSLETFGRVDALVNNAYVEDVFKTFRRGRARRLAPVDGGEPLRPPTGDQGLRPPHDGTRRRIDRLRQLHDHPQAHGPAGGIRRIQGRIAGSIASARQELGRFHIRVNSVLPGWMWGPQVELYVRMGVEQRGIPEDEVLAEITRDIPLGRVPTDEEVAGAVIFLASDLAAAVTGQSLDANGGEVFA